MAVEGGGGQKEVMPESRGPCRPLSYRTWNGRMTA